ncbi:MAG: class I SAM-dependent methyltransferase [Cytophagales bacterium]
MNNKSVYQSENVVKSYSKSDYILAAEKIIFEKYGARISNGFVLDLGVGGGRTTRVLSRISKQYLGIDYSPSMIESCKQSFPTVDFAVADASELSFIFSDSVDFCLFSFNGIDCVSIDVRQLIYKEIYRVLKPDSLFVFSFHNSQCIPDLYNLQFPKNPLNWFKELNRYKKIREYNGNYRTYYQENFFSIYDGAENFSTKVLYSKPEFQVSDLQTNNFEIVNLLDAESGRFLDEKSLNSIKCPWIYVVAKKS